MFEKYVKQNTTEKGIKLIRRYYGIIGKKIIITSMNANSVC